MTKSYRKTTQRVSASLKPLRADIGATTTAFSALAQAATRDGAIDKKTKELVALVLSVQARCDPYIGFHAEACARLRATRVDVEETIGLGIYLGGGPSLVYGGDALVAYEDSGGEKASLQA